MIAILLLNAMGYYGIFLGMQYRNERMMNSSLDADAYDQANAITLKIPVTIPYISDQTDFSRATGKFEHEGQLYRIVKQDSKNIFRNNRMARIQGTGSVR